MTKFFLMFMTTWSQVTKIQNTMIFTSINSNHATTTKWNGLSAFLHLEKYQYAFDYKDYLLFLLPVELTQLLKRYISFHFLPMVQCYYQQIYSQWWGRLFYLCQFSADKVGTHVQLNILMQIHALFHKLSKTNKNTCHNYSKWT